VPRLRTRGTIPPLSHTPSWHGISLSTETTLPFSLAVRATYAAHVILRVVSVKEERRLKVFENRVLRGIFGRKGEEVVG
jgi:hypothetical protein